jgi:hypothetical protein
MLDLKPNNNINNTHFMIKSVGFIKPHADFIWSYEIVRKKYFKIIFTYNLFATLFNIYDECI